MSAKYSTNCLHHFEEQVVFSNLVALTGAAHDVVDERSDTCVIWDEETSSDISTHVGLLQQLARGDSLLLELGMDSVDDVFDEMPSEVLWDDEVLFGCGTHDGLLQQLAFDGEAKDFIGEPDINDMLTHVSNSSLFPKIGTDVAAQVSLETPNLDIEEATLVDLEQLGHGFCAEYQLPGCKLADLVIRKGVGFAQKILMFEETQSWKYMWCLLSWEF
ncbi:hypothetical protein ACP4OV_012513 [Aristida adscensionis]